MKFIVSSGNLLKQLQLISGVIGPNTVLPILEDFLFSIEKGELTLYATDLEISMSIKMNVESKEDFKVAIPARILTDTLKTLPEQPITFSIDKKTYALELSSENGKYKLAGENPDNFPKIPEPEDTTKTIVAASILSRAINKTLFAVSSDELRPAMTGVLFQLTPEGLTFVSTDAHKLVRYSRSDATSEKAASFIIPKKALSLLKGALPSDETPVSIAYNNSNAFFSFDEINLICRLVDAKYPDYNAVIPKENPNKLEIGRNDLQNTLKRVSIFASKTTNQVVLNLAGSEVKVSAQDLDFSNEASERLPCNYEGEDMEIGFNARFLIEMLQALETDEVRMELSSPNKAGVIFPTKKEEKEEILMLVMPVMLSA